MLFNLKKILMGAGLIVSLIAFATAPRKITIPAKATTSTGVSSQGIELFNGSSVNVNYNVTCFGRNGAQLMSKTGLTLAPKNKRRHGGNVLCMDDNTPYFGSTLINDVMTCGWSSTYTTASQLCPTGFAVCTHAQVIAGVGTDTNTSGWVSDINPSNYSGNWSYSTDNGSTWTNVTGNTNHPRAHANSSFKCATANSGGGTIINHCLGGGTTGSVYCCPTEPVDKPSEYCTIEIDSSTSADGFFTEPAI